MTRIQTPPSGIFGYPNSEDVEVIGDARKLAVSLVQLVVDALNIEMSSSSVPTPSSVEPSTSLSEANTRSIGSRSCPL